MTNVVVCRLACRPIDGPIKVTPLSTTYVNIIRGVATGVYRDIYPPKSVDLKFFVCGCSVSLQGLVNIYTHPNQIPGYAFEYNAI